MCECLKIALKKDLSLQQFNYALIKNKKVKISVYDLYNKLSQNYFKSNLHWIKMGL